jgi:hypothetical protein
LLGCGKQKKKEKRILKLVIIGAGSIGLLKTILDLLAKLKKEYNYIKDPIFMHQREGDIPHFSSDSQKHHRLIRATYITNTTI